MEVLTLKGLHYHARHGYYKEERANGNDFEIDLIFNANLKQAGLHDDLNLTIDYVKAEKMVSEVMNGPSIKLIETLVEKIGTRLFAEFKNARKLTVKVRKLNPPLPVNTKYSEIQRQWTR